MGATVSSHKHKSNLYDFNLDKNNETNDKNDFSFSDNVYTPEAIFSAWLNLSFFSVTASMLFYDLTKKKSLPTHPLLAGIIAISLIVVSISYVYFGVYPYYSRMNNAINSCSLNKECKLKDVSEIKQLRNQFTLLGIATIIIDIFIAILIIIHTIKLL